MGDLFRGKTYDFEVVGKETSSFLESILDGLDMFRGVREGLRGRRALGTKWNSVLDDDIKGVATTSFFFARSPEAPNITRTVSSCISREVDIIVSDSAG